MTTLHVSRFRARYRLPASQQMARERLDGVLRDLLREALEVALGRAGISAREEVCIRQLHVPVRLRLALGDPALAAVWSIALADALHSALEHGGADVVRYGSRAHALTDLVAGAAAGDLRRSWAWRQLGLWRPGDDASPQTTSAATARALAASPGSVVAVLAAAARAGLLPMLLRRLPPDAWTVLARAAHAAHAAPADPTLLLEAPAAPDSGAEPGSSGTGAASVLVARVLRTSTLARLGAATPELAPATPELAPAQRRALAVLAVLEAEPTALRQAPAAAALVAAVAQRLLPTAGRPVTQPPRRTEPDPPAQRTDRQPAPAERPEHSAPAPPAAAEVLPSPPVGKGAGEGGLDTAPSAADDGYPALPPRQRGETRWAGLLFLLHVVGELGIPEEILASGTLAPHPFRRVMHRLALALAPLEADDPAALAFAGLAPDQPPPSPEEPESLPASETVDAEVRLLARRVAARALERLRGEPPADLRDATGLLRALCRRRGAIVADPGWLDVYLSLDEVSTGVRRAGLDLDPGWIPWLGVVVRFVYE